MYNSSENPNIGWLFYKKIFIKYRDKFTNEAVNQLISGKQNSNIQEIFENNNNKLLNINIEKYKNITENFHKGKDSFSLTTTYPGLLVGSGYNYGIGVDSEFKLGFSFDWTTGIPILPGAGIKGVLRNVFKSKDLLCEILKIEKNNILDKIKNKDDSFFKKLEMQIFEGKNPENAKHLPIKNRDIFYDAFPYKNTGSMLSDDYITPHKDDLKNPIPIKFLKIKPNVEICLSFNLNNTIIDNVEITNEHKKNIFRDIIINIGIGAKTNVGYGYLRK